MPELNYRFKQIKGMIPASVRTVLDVGCDERTLEPFFDKYIGLDLENAEINQNLNKSQKIPLKNKSVDLVILSQILEHIADPSEIISESKRVAKKYVLVGLPSDFTIDNRIRVLFNIRGLSYDPYGHKHWFNPKTAEDFVKMFFGKWEKKENIFAVKGGRFLPQFLRQFLTDIYPDWFAKEIYYLVKLS
ncbi:MAG: methionine biosynthesis protein MetW [archaeon]|nr:methionine biosynthesis protein MetW [archaeon]